MNGAGDANLNALQPTPLSLASTMCCFPTMWVRSGGLRSAAQGKAAPPGAANAPTMFL